MRKINKILCAALAVSMFIGTAGCTKGVSNEPAENGQDNVTAVQENVPEAKDIILEAKAYDDAQADYRLSIDAGNEIHDISELLYGIFFEDINFAADGGLYAEMVKNRSFEFTNLAANNELHGWSAVNKAGLEVIKNDTEGYLNENNPNYLLITNKNDEPAGTANGGWLDGMYAESGEKYDISFYARGAEGYAGPVYVEICEGTEVLCSGRIPSVSEKWQKYDITLTPSKTAGKAVRLQIRIDRGSIALDMVSMFPGQTYRNEENGLRKDLAELLEALHPAFLRFPGGCVIEGVSLAKAYDWKASIGVGPDGSPMLWNGKYGDVAVRKMGQNIWTDESMTNDRFPSFMSYGLGFYEYFRLAEDIGAVGVPVLNCGLACMGQGTGTGPKVGTKEFARYVQDALDLVEFCRGGADTTWGRVRCDLGHEEPFKLRYIAIGNEQFGTDFFEHYEAFRDAFAEAAAEDPAMYGDIELIYSAGLDDGDSGNAGYMQAYRRAGKWLDANPGSKVTDYAGAIDQHYYNAPDWFLANTDYYDEKNYSRTKEGMTSARFGGAIPVFLGEYAAQSNNLRAALSEAAYMTGLERNGDIVVMAAYAPLFGNYTATHWSPDLIWFNNHSAMPSVNYYVQQLFAQNAGTKAISSLIEGAEAEPEPLGGCVGVGTWDTAATFSNIRVVNNKTGEELAADDFSSGELSAAWTKVSDGVWKIENGTLKQTNAKTNTDRYGTTGTAAYFGDTSWTDYTYTLNARIDSGSEGFLIPFAVKDKNNNYFWNIGGWGNTVSCLQQVSDGSKSGQLAGTSQRLNLTRGRTYSLKVVVSEFNVKCYIDDKIYIDYDLDAGTLAECYQVVSKDADGDIIVKLVNVTGEAKTVAVDVKNAGSLSEYAGIQMMSGSKASDENRLGSEESVAPVTGWISGIEEKFNIEILPYSVTVIRLKK